MVNLVFKEDIVIKYKCSIISIICGYPLLFISVENSMLTNTKNYGAKFYHNAVFANHILPGQVTDTI